MSKGFGYGKVILFGEHFVVYGKKAIATAISLKTTIEIEEGPWNISGELKQAFLAVLEKLGIEKSFRINVLETVPIKKNLGSSAAIIVAFVRALNEKYGLNLGEEEINSVAFEGEKVMHGTPSGIDNSCAVYGKPIIFKKGNPPLIEKLEKSHSFDLLIIDSGYKSLTTKEAISLFKKNKESFSGANHLFEAYDRIFEEAVNALKSGDKEKLGLLMDFNNGLLNAFGVSSKGIEELCFLTKSLGALGAKLSGAGSGGNMIALFKNKEEALKALNIIKKYGYDGFYVRI